MAYEIHRVDTVKNREGQDEVFVQISYTDEVKGTIIPYAKWLSQSEQEQYLKDERTLESVLIPKWLLFATAQHAEAKAAEEASKLTMAKAIAALVDSGAMVKTTAGKFSQEQVATLEAAAKVITDDKVDAVVSPEAVAEPPNEEPLEGETP